MEKKKTKMHIYDDWKCLFREDGIEIWEVNYKYLALDRYNRNSRYFYNIREMQLNIELLRGIR